MDNNIKFTPPQFSNIKYLVLDYIQSSGTQYIDTGVKADTSYYRIDFNMSAVSFNNTSVYGHYGSDSPRRSIGFGAFSSSGLTCGFGLNNESAYPLGITDYNFHDISVEYSNGVGKYKSDSSDYSSVSVSGIDGSVSDYIFAYHDYSLGAKLNCSIKLSYFKIYSGSSTTLVRDYIPVIRWSDLAIGMYDKANDKFYANAGSGTFGKGNVIGIIK